ncbi:deoxyguanosinetriphosphate triphosphohydrolase [Acidobacteria bacterium AH-259-D05]|nr:deoxyguanosinetriphosphate triphosphohydrolase [Acidobacteria bacterium AH-259-D05]
MKLAPYAMRDELTEGRRYPEEPHPYRSEYQRDRDRIVHTKAFRRLEHKTQVFDPDYSDHFRNRLTHTIEVSQITRTISQALGLNIDLCEVLALSHDIGHPPFSHEGEMVLDQLMRKHDSGFEHNLHGLRIVEDFEEKYASFRGLNLTFEVREGIIKHSRDYTKEDEPYVDIREYRLGEFPPLEAQLVDLADEVAYNTADLDDGYDSGLLTLEQMVDQVELFRVLHQQVKAKYPKASEKLQVSETVRGLIDVLVTSLVSESRRVLEAQAIDSVDKVRRSTSRLLGFEKHIVAQNQELKNFLHRNLYYHEIMQHSRKRAQHLLEELFHYYVENPHKLPESHNTRISILGLERIVCDYIAGMTDKYAQGKYAENFGSNN